MSKEKMNGFTLVELLIAMFIFSILTAFAFRATSILSQSSLALEEEQGVLLGIQKAVLMIERDIRQLTNKTGKAPEDARSVSSEDESEENAGQRINLSSGVSYYLEQGNLFRENIRTEGDASKLRLLEGINSLEMNYVRSNESASKSESGKLPGIEFNLNMEGYGAIKRVIYLGLATQPQGNEQELVGRLNDAAEPSATTMTEEEQEILDAL